MTGARIMVAGAGVLGLSCALELARAGAKVTVCDPGPPVGGASGVAAGMLAPVFEALLDAEARPHFDLLMAARDLWPAFADKAGITLDRTGALAAGDAAWIADLDASMRGLGVKPQGLTLAQARDLAPGLSAQDALMTREDWKVEAKAALTVLRAAIEAAGGRFSDQATHERGDADWLVVATGASRDLAPELAALTPIKGHIIRIETNSPSALAVRGQGAYAAPVAGGLLLGATMEAGVGDPAVDPAKVGPLLMAGERLFPGLSQAPREILAGVRATTPDGLPLVGASLEPGVILAAGARRNGWLLAPLVAKVVAAQVMGGEAGPYARKFDARRYG